MASRIFVLMLVAVFTVCPSVAQFGFQAQYFAQAAAGGGSLTDFSIYNPGTASVTVRIELRASDGELFHESSVTVPASGTQTVSIGASLSTLKVGWAKLSTTAGEFSATEFFRLRVGGQDLPRVGVLAGSPASKLRVFGYVGGQTNTGIAAANPSGSNTATLNVRLLGANGTSLLAGTTTLAPRSHAAAYLNQAPWFAGLQNFEGIVEIESNEPVILTMLRSDNSLLAAAPVMTPSASGVSLGGITRDYLADGAVSTEKIADGAVTGVKIANGAVNFNQLHPNVATAITGVQAEVTALSEVSDGKTRLLFPYVSNRGGYDTGIAIVNTGEDPFPNSTGATGKVTLYYYGQYSSGGTPPSMTSDPIPPGQMLMYTAAAGSGPYRGGIVEVPSFSGYVIAVCNFPFAHGIYQVTNGTTSWGGEAIVLSPDRVATRNESRGH